MAETNTIEAVAMTAITPLITAELFGVPLDVNALIGAFSGGVMYAMWAAETPLLQRFANLVISIFVGYFGAMEAPLIYPSMNTPFFVAFFTSLLVVLGTSIVLKKVAQGRWVNRIPFIGDTTKEEKR